MAAGPSGADVPKLVVTGQRPDRAPTLLPSMAARSVQGQVQKTAMSVVVLVCDLGASYERCELCVEK